MEPSEAIQANQAAWDEAAHRFKDRWFAYLLKRFQEPGFSCLQGARRYVVGKLGVEGKAVAQLCCNNGREILSIKNLGASFCAGFDLSENLISQAKELAAAGNIACDLIACDVHEIPESYNLRFDLVVITAGSLRWMPDLNAFFKVVTRLLKPGGRLFINEIHPILDCFEKREGGQPVWRRSYFHGEPVVSHRGIAYEGVEDYEANPHVWYHHRISGIVTSAIRAGLELTLLDELTENISGAYDYLVPAGVSPPFSYVLIAQKKGP